MRISALFIMFLLAWNCNQKADGPPLQKSIIETEVKQLLNDYVTDIREHGLTAEEFYLDTSAAFFWVPPGYSTALGIDSLMAAIRCNATSLQRVNNEWETLKVFALSDDLASYTGVILSEITDTTGEIHNFKLIESGMLIRRKSGWKLLSGQTNLLHS